MEAVRECFVLAFSNVCKREDESHLKHTQTSRALQTALQNAGEEQSKVRELERTITELGEKLLHTVDMWFADEDVVAQGQDFPAKKSR